MTNLVGATTDEGRRLEAIVEPHSDSRIRLTAADLLDTEPEVAFDRITRLAARIIGVPVSLVSILDTDRQFFKSQVGLPDIWAERRETPLSHSFCQYVVASGEPLVVDDARSHPLVCGNLAIEDLGVEAYLGVPIRTPDGAVIGSLCAIDHAPRHWTSEDRRAIEDLVAMLGTELVLREEVRFRREAEEQAQLLAREMAHRVKNSLATVQAIVSLSLRSRQPAEAIRPVLLERLGSLAKTQSLVMVADWRGASFAAIVASEIEHYDVGTRIRTAGPEVWIAPGDAVTIGMILHELATNAAKYGALAPGREGTIDIDWQEATSEGEGRRLRLTWREDGRPGTSAAPESDDTEPSGFGSELLDKLIVRQLAGRIDRDWSDRGLVFTADFAISEPMSA
ncbi:sensor histidine kinase [Aurantimonas sp. A3-2-R12]|uniref:sensor histidine kinase n=1 Tax=Aurantimonas sp. A3-2-R12 TaxID=3114362 RepID=UPI002E173ECC|nr:HWE histidine kinase domain-containing protein [Aurantimonas sp. A3-2-R12]